MPERAARSKLLRTMSNAPPGSLRAYDKAASESHKQALVLLEHGLLTTGVLHDIPVGAISHQSSGWVEAYTRPYSHRTSDSDIDSAVPPDARYVLLGAYNVRGGRSGDRYIAGGFAVRPSPDRDALIAASCGKKKPSGAFEDAMVYSLLAWGTRDAVLGTTHHKHDFAGGPTSAGKPEHGVHFYRWPGHAMGFSSDPTLFLMCADAGCKRGIEERRPEDRLSWSLERRSTGGWRAGRAYDLGDSNMWFKAVYYRM